MLPYCGVLVFTVMISRHFVFLVTCASGGSPVMQQLQRDKSWRVRYMAADHFCEVRNVAVTRSEGRTHPFHSCASDAGTASVEPPTWMLQLCDVVSKELVEKEMSASLVRLLKDTEPEVLHPRPCARSAWRRTPAQASKSEYLFELLPVGMY